MNGKELVKQALRGEKTERAPWVPFVGVHGGFLQGLSAQAYLQSAEHLVNGLKLARQRYKPDGLPVLFDLQVEAEVLGCKLVWADEAPPAVASHPLADKPFDAPLPEIDETKGRFPMVVDALERLHAEMGDEVALYGLITGPFTLALHLRGNDIFLDMFDDEEGVKALIMRCAEFAKQAADIYLDHGVDVIAVVDPMTSQVSPDHFSEFITPAVNGVFDHVRARGALSSMFVCGDATRNLENMCASHADNVSIDENISLESLRDLAHTHGVSFGGNMKLTTVLLLGDVEDAQLDTLRCMDTGGRTGFILAPGCDLPYATPPENLEAVAELVHDEYKCEVARASLHAKAVDSFEDVAVPDYHKQRKVIVDVITLNSSACAPCQYMVEAVQKAAAGVDAELEIHERKITTREGLGYMCKLGVGNLPTICIDGEPKFVSIIPDQPTLQAALQQAVEHKDVIA